MGIKLLLRSGGNAKLREMGLKKLKRFASVEQTDELDELYAVIIQEEGGGLDVDLMTAAILVFTFVLTCLCPVHVPTATTPTQHFTCS